MEQEAVSEAEKYTWGKGIVWSQCVYCSRMGESMKVSCCTAFPGRIPQVILSNEADHRKVWIDPATGQPGDTGVRGDESLLFDPKPGVDPDVLDRLYRKLDKIP